MVFSAHSESSLSALCFLWVLCLCNWQVDGDEGQATVFHVTIAKQEQLLSRSSLHDSLDPHLLNAIKHVVWPAAVTTDKVWGLVRSRQYNKVGPYARLPILMPTLVVSIH